MSDTAPQKSQQDRSTGSAHTLASRHPNISNPIASKRVCFYKSGDPQFSGLRLVVNSRTFKTFDALLDSLSKKVPLPFGVRTITTPSGVRAVKTLEELQDGKSYICSDRKKVKPINLKMASKKLPPWYSARPFSGRRRVIQLARQSVGRATRRENPVRMWTPKRLVVFKNGDPGIKHTIVLQKKTMQTFESLLDYMSETMQFPVVKLHSPDGRRVDGLPALILSSGVLVATGREPFRSGNYDHQKPSLPTRLPTVSNRKAYNRLQPMTRKKKSQSSSSKSRNFSLSSERYFVNQIHNSIAGSLSDLPSNPTGSVEIDPNATLESVEADTCTCTCARDLGGTNQLMPPNDDIEKSFQVNQDGSMTVEMKVRLTIKQEETIHWSTTLARSSVANQLKAACIPQSALHSHSPEFNVLPSKGIDGTDAYGHEYREENDVPPNENGYICEEEKDEPSSVEAGIGEVKLRRAQTPGPRSLKKKQASVESVKMETETGIQENVVSAYSYIEETADGNVTEECCMVRQCNSRPIPKPRTLEISNNRQQTTFKSTGVAEILQIQEHGEESTETALHICEQQSCQGNFFAKTQFRVQSQHVRSVSTDTGLYSSSNDFELDLRRPSTASESVRGRRADAVSSSPDPVIPSCKGVSDLTTDYVAQTAVQSFSGTSFSDRECSESLSLADTPVGRSSDQDRRKHTQPKVKQDNVLSSLSLKRKGRNEDTVKDSIKVKTDILANASSKKQAEQSSQQQPGEIVNKWKGNGAVKDLIKSSKLPETLNAEHSNGLLSDNELNQIKDKFVRDQPVNVNAKDVSLKKNVKDLLPPVEPIHIRKVLTKQKSMNEDRSGAGGSREFSESVSFPALLSSPAVVNEYVEHWLEKSHPEPTPFMDDVNHTETDRRVDFQITNEKQSFHEESKRETGRSNAEERLPCDSNITKRLMSGVPTVEKVEMAFDNGSGENQSSCNPTQTVRDPLKLKPRLEGAQNKTQVNTDRTQTRAGKCFTSKSTEQLDMRLVLEKLSLSIQAIRQISQHKRPSCLEKSHSVPDFSSHVTSTFGSSYQVLLAFLSVMTLKEGISTLKTNETLAQRLCCTEALKMIESLKKIASIEDADELKASLSDLQKSTSSQLLQSWKSFQELNDKAPNYRSLPDISAHELSFETCPEESNTKEKQPFDIQELVRELSMTAKLQEELAALVNGKTSDVTLNDNPTENSEVNGTAESYPDEKVTDFEESIIEQEAVNFIKSNFEKEVCNYVKSIVEEVIRANYVIGSNVSIASEKDKYANLQQADLREKPESCTEDPVHQEEEQVFHEKDQIIYEEEKDRYSEQQPCSVEEQDSCIEQQASHEGEQWSFEEEHGSYTAEQACFVEQSTCVEEQASYELEEASYAEEQAGSVDEQKTSTEHQFSHGEEQASDEECKKSYAGQGCCERECAREGAEKKENNKNQFSHQEAHASYVEDKRDFIDMQSTYEEGQACCAEEQARSVEEQRDNTGCQSSQEDAHLSHEEDQSSYEEGQNCSEGEQGSCLEEQEDNKENQSDHEEEHDSYVEDKGHYLDEQSSYREENDSYATKQTSSEEKESRYEEDQADCVPEQESSTEQHQTYEEKQSSSEDKQVCYNKDQGTYDKEQDSHVEEKQSICEQQLVDYIKQKANYDEDNASNVEKKSSFEPHGQMTVSAESGVNGFNNASHLSRKQSEIEEFKRGTSQMRMEHNTGVLSKLHSVADEAEEEDESEESVYNSVSQSVKTLEDLANSLRSAALNSSLAFSYDSKSSFQKESEGTRVKSIRDMFLARSNVELQHGHKRLPSPNTSDLSDYRPETSDSEGHRSLNTSTESGEDDPGRQSIVKGYVKRTIERLYGKTNAVGQRPPSASKTKRKQSPGRNSVCTLTSFHEARSKAITDLSYFNATSSYDTCDEPTQCIAMNTRGDAREGVLIDKGKWLLKENHLIRKSPPEHSPTYGNAHATSVEAGQEDASNDAPYSYFGSNSPPLAVISSPDFEDPPVPKCTYLSLPHGHDSDPVQNDPTVKTKKGTKVDPEKKDSVSPTGEKNGSVPSFASVEFRKAGNKVHPQSEGPVVATQPAPAQAAEGRVVQEQDPLDMLFQMCGQHCPIL